MAWPRPNMCAMCHVMSQPSLCVTWHGLGLAQVPYGMAWLKLQFMCHVAWIRSNICAMWHVLCCAYMPCGMAQSQLMCHMAQPRPNICGMSYAFRKCHMASMLSLSHATWHGLAYVACGMSQPRLSAMWHGLNLTQMPCGMAQAQHKYHVTWPRFNLCSTCHVQAYMQTQAMPHVTKPRLGTMWPKLINRQVSNKQVGRYIYISRYVLTSQVAQIPYTINM